MLYRTYQTAPVMSLRMEPKEDERSLIQEFYSGANIFITGGTGFVGKTLIEKLLRSCPHINNIYLLIRTKKNKDLDTRLKEIFEDPLFDTVKEKYPKFHQKVRTVHGDCGEPGLGLKPSDELLLKDKINIIFHVAATVRFNEELKNAIKINLTGTKCVVELAHEMANLKAVIHVSTAYSNCHLREIDEKFYNYSISGKGVAALLECIDDNKSKIITPILSDGWPNTYTFTKAMTEDFLRAEGIGLPIGIFRPTIVVATNKEPISGWIGNSYGPSGIMMGSGMGVLKSVNCDHTVLSDIVPVDMVINALIASTWQIGNRLRAQTDEDILIFNYVSSVQKPITWGEFADKCTRNGEEFPPINAVWSCSTTLNKHNFMHSIYIFFLHYIPAFIIDGIRLVLGKKPKFLKLLQKIEKLCQLITFFTTREFQFRNDNVVSLWQKMGKLDRQLFDFNMDNVDWDSYCYSYSLGVRKYLFKDDPCTIPQAKQRYRRLKLLHISSKYIALFLVVNILWSLRTVTSKIF